MTIQNLTAEEFLMKLDATLDEAERDFETRLITFLSGCREFIERVSAERYPQAPTPTVAVERYRRFLRVVRHDPSYKSAQCFVDTSNGNVLPASGWVRPASIPSANLFDESNGLANMTAYGVKYNR